MITDDLVTARVFRFDPAVDPEPRYQTYTVPILEPITAMILMRLLHAQDATLACRIPMCFKGMCGDCFVRLNGKDVRGCTALVNPGQTVTLEPHSGYELIRDLVVDFERRKQGVSDDNE